MKQMSLLSYALCCLMLALLSLPVFAKGVYQTSAQFLSSTLGDINVQAKVIWLNQDDKAVIEDILSHKYSRLRVRYWQKELETVWILDEIGKEKPITIGIHIVENKIKKLNVLTYRESRGDEVKHEFFTQQFNNATLEADNSLSQHIDGITGATLSVRALTKVAAIALWLHKKEMALVIEQ